jgi:hypothetical protein
MKVEIKGFNVVGIDSVECFEITMWQLCGSKVDIVIF